MKIECVLKRKGGTRVKLDDAEYHFNPGQDEDGNDLKKPHVAEVRHQAHVARLLQIPEAYRIYDPAGVLIDTANQVPAPAPTKSVVEEPQNPTAVGAEKYSGLSRDELVKLVHDRTGKSPHPNAKDETLVKILVAHDNKPVDEGANVSGDE